MKKIKKIFSFAFELLKYYLLFPIAMLFFYKKNIYLISERGYDARDNAYHLFKYMRTKHKDVNCYYIITKESADLKKISNLGNIIYYGSLKHYLYFIAAKYKISTHSFGYSTNSDFYYRCSKIILMFGKKVFLQHGITKDNLTMLYKENTGFDLFITSSELEYRYVLENFHYSEREIKKTGLARFDFLYDNKDIKNQILIMPTWRSDLAKLPDKLFKKTEFFQKWFSLLNDEKVLKEIEEKNIKIIFYLHAEFQKYSHLFSSSSKNVIIAKFADFDVQKLLIESKLLITDYSSVYFDFAYMKKPVIYYQFDLSSYRKNHYKQGYFTYETMGFGEVIADESSIVKTICKYIKDDFIMSNKYSKRVDDFFDIRDKNNCERIYLAISNLDKE